MLETIEEIDREIESIIDDWTDHPSANLLSSRLIDLRTKLNHVRRELRANTLREEMRKDVEQLRRGIRGEPS